MNLLFDFGSAQSTMEGFTKVHASDVYDVEQHYGFVRNELVSDLKRSDAPLHGDSCIPFDASFIVDVADGNYIVAVTIGDEIAPTHTTIKSNGERLVLKDIRTVPGQFTRELFAVNVCGGQLKLSFSGTAPRINGLEIIRSEDKITIYLAGDSTVTDSSEAGFPFSGWGQMLPYFFKHDVAIANHAIGGRSSKSFITEGRLKVIEDNIKDGDYLLIQFGHNDQKTDEHRSTDPETTYPEHLQKYIDVAHAKGATPILLTSVHRQYFNDDGTLIDTHQHYLEAVRKLAAEENVLLIDLANKSKELFEQLGPEETKSIFLWGHPGEWINHSAGVKDRTHFQENGGLKIAELVIEGIRELQLQQLLMFLRS